VLLDNEHEPPASVIVTTLPLPDPVAEHDENPVGRPIVGLVGIENAELKVTASVSPEERRLPEGPFVKATVQVVFVAPATWDEPEKLTLATDAANAGVASRIPAANRPTSNTVPTRIRRDHPAGRR